MRCVLRRREVVRDDWRHWGEDPQGPLDASGLIVPWQELRANAQAWSAYAGALGVRIGPADKVEELSPQLGRMALIAVEFPTPSEGRGYTQGRLLRERFGFTAELRAVGAAVKQDLIFALARCGFDAFEVARGEDLEGCAHALQRYSVAYQAASAVEGLRRRF